MLAGSHYQVEIESRKPVCEYVVVISMSGLYRVCLLEIHRLFLYSCKQIVKGLIGDSMWSVSWSVSKVSGAHFSHSCWPITVKLAMHYPYLEKMCMTYFSRASVHSLESYVPLDLNWHWCLKAGISVLFRKTLVVSKFLICATTCIFEEFREQ